MNNIKLTQPVDSILGILYRSQYNLSIQVVSQLANELAFNRQLQNRRRRIIFTTLYVDLIKSWNNNLVCTVLVFRAKNKALGLAGQAEILIGHLYNLIQSWSFWVAIVENCTENGHGQLLF